MYKGIEVEAVKIKTMKGRKFDMVTCTIKYHRMEIATYQDNGNGGSPNVDIIGNFIENEKGEYVPSLLYLRNKELLEELGQRLLKLEGSINCLEDNIGRIVEDTIMLKEAKKGILFREADSFSYRILKFKAGTIPFLIDKEPDKIVPLLEKYIKEEQEKGSTILMQEYYISIGVNPSIFKRV